MKFHWCLLIVALLVAAISANPINEEFGSDVGSSSRTWEAIMNFFQPMLDWFRTELPQKSPQDLANDVRDVARDANDWANENKFVQGAIDTFQPVGQWVQDTANSFKDKTFRELVDDGRQALRRVDDTVGDWMEDKLQK